MRLSVLAPAKINLFLGVGARRDDGYHDVTTVLHALDLADTVVLEESEALGLTSDVDLGVPVERNLATRAAVELGHAVGRHPGVSIALTKRIPAGAGLGGGSSDAAAVLMGLAQLWELGQSDPRILTVARAVGADVPFFLEGGAALFTGRGDVLESDLPSARVAVALVKPDPPVSTVEAYARFDDDPYPPGEPLAVIEALQLGDVDALAAALENNLAPAAGWLVPEVAEAVAWCRTLPGVLGANVSGSGSAVFAICPTDDDAERVAAEARLSGWWAASTSTSAHGARRVEGSW